MSDGKIKKFWKDNKDEIIAKSCIAVSIVGGFIITVGVGTVMYGKGILDGADQQYQGFLDFEKEKVPEAFEIFKKYIADNDLKDTCPYKNWD